MFFTAFLAVLCFPSLFDFFFCWQFFCMWVIAGAGFVRFETCEECDAAIAALDGKHRMQGSPNPLMVRYAASPKPKSAKLGPDNKMHQSQQV